MAKPDSAASEGNGRFTRRGANFALWIEALAAEWITGGRGGGNSGPLNAVTRGQMAAFLSATFKLP